MAPYLTPWQIFENYKKTNPQKCKGKSTTEICRLAGLSDKQIAELKTTSAWLFCFDKENPSINQDFSMTEIFGGNFSKTKTNHKTHFNRKIEPTKQSETQVDCWLLSDINALNYTKWGQKAIYDAILPDEDGSGGVTIIFKGSPLEEKSIHITAEQFEQAKKSGNYSAGDDDMIAFELATEITFRKMIEQGIAQKSSKYRDVLGGVATDKYKQYPISELLGINSYIIDCDYLNEYAHKNMDKEKDDMFKWLSENKDNISVQCSITTSYGDEDTKDYIHYGHAYAIKKIIYNKEVILTDPYYSDYDIKVPYDKFKEHAKDINISFKDSNTETKFKNNKFLKNYEYGMNKFIENQKKTKEDEQKKLQAKRDAAKTAELQELMKKYEKNFFKK